MEKTNYRQLEEQRSTPQAIGERLAILRKYKEFTQATLSKACDISQQTIAALESGRVSDPRHLPIIATTLHVSVEYLRYGRAKGVPILHSRATNDYFPVPGVDVSPATKMLQIVPKHTSRAFAFDLEDDAADVYGVFKHDLIAVDPGVEPVIGKLVVIRYKGVLTVRRYRELESRQLFVTDNEDYGPLDSTTAEFIGKVVQVVRTY